MLTAHRDLGQAPSSRVAKLRGVICNENQEGASISPGFTSLPMAAVARLARSIRFLRAGSQSSDTASAPRAGSPCTLCIT